MKAPRFRIASIMLIVAVAALNLGVLQARILRNHSSLLGALPMANALAVGMVTPRQRRGGLPFLVGFLAFGAIAVAAYAAVVTWFDGQIKTLYIAPVLRYLVQTIGQSRAAPDLTPSRRRRRCGYSGPATICLRPDGRPGSSRRYRISIITRPAQPPADT